MKQMKKIVLKQNTAGLSGNMKTEQVFKGAADGVTPRTLQLKSKPGASVGTDVLAKIKGQNALKELKEQLASAEAKAT